MTVFETQRLALREIREADFEEIYAILGDVQTMYAYEHAFTREEAERWISKQLKNYRLYGFGLWAVLLKETDNIIGQCGITMQSLGESWEVPEIGYLFNRHYWHKGYATEAACACKRYAFDVLKMREVYSIIRDSNVSSQRVAERNGMKRIGMFTKYYYGIHMPHYIYKAVNPEFQNI